jgi:hypothetical protein
MFGGIVIAIRGHWPSLFTKEIEAQIILGVPHRRRASRLSWGFAAVAVLLLARGASLLHDTLALDKPDGLTVIRNEIGKLADKIDSHKVMTASGPPPTKAIPEDKEAPSLTKYPKPPLPSRGESQAPPHAPTAEEIAAAVTRLLPPQAQLSTGNLKERAAMLAQDIMMDLYRWGFPVKRNSLVRIPGDNLSPIGKIPDEPGGYKHWSQVRSVAFRMKFLKSVRDTRAEFAQLHIVDGDLDDSLQWISRLDEEDRLRNLPANAPSDRDILSFIVPIAEGLIRMSDRLKN